MEAFIEICQIVVNKQPVGGSHIEDFLELLEQGRHIPPITVRTIEGGKYVLVDGRHRLQAHIRYGLNIIDARITKYG